ncbi:MAG: lipopolysaccharide heptosyltransferase II [Caldimicrobium sp.]
MLIRLPNWLGDALMATPVYENLRSYEKLILFGPATFVNLFEDFPQVKILPYYKGNNKLNLANLKPYKNERALLLTNSFSSAWLFFRADFKEVMGYSTDLRGFLLTKKVNPPKEKLHQRDYYLYLIEKLGFTLKQRDLILPLKEEKILEAQKFLKNKGIEIERAPLILIAPGAAYGPAKKWPEDYYRKLSQELVKKGFNILIVGSEGEKLLGDYIKGEAKGIYNLCGETTITTLAGIFSLSNLLISNDSGLMHLGAALKIPQIAIFGSTDPLFTAPLNPRAIILKLNLDCSPCFKRECPKGHYNCLRSITPDEVLQKILTLPQDYFKPKNSFQNGS